MRVSWALAGTGAPGAAAQESAATGYLLQRRTSPGAWEDLAMLPAGTTEWDDTTVRPGIDYAYRLQVLDAAGNDSDFATTLDEVRSLPLPPAPPVLSTATTLSADSMRLTWSPAAGSEQTGYRIEQSRTAAGPFTAIAAVSSEATSYAMTGLNADTNYLFRLVALNEAGESASSNMVAGTTRSQTLPQPRNVRASLLTDGSVQVSWTGAPTNAQAVIQVNPEGLAGYESLGSSPAAGPYAYTPVSPGNNRYRVKFVRGDTESPYGETPQRLATRGYGPIALKQLYLPLVVR